MLLVAFGLFQSKKTIHKKLAIRIASLLLVGLLLTLLTNLSKLHLLWWIPISFFVPIFFTLRNFDKDDVDENKKEVVHSTTDNIGRNKIVQAEKIVREFSELLDPSRDIGKPAHPISLLRNSKEEIKQAYKDLTLALKESKLLTEDVFENLKAGYSLIELFIPDDEAQTVNMAVQKIQRGETETEAEQHARFEFTKIVSKSSASRWELNDVVGEN